MQLVEIDALDAQRCQTRFTRRSQVTSSSVWHPLSIRARQSTFGCNHDAGTISAPGSQSTGDEAFVVADVRVVQAIRVRRVEQGDATVERRVQHVDAARLVALATSLVAVAL